MKVKSKSTKLKQMKQLQHTTNDMNEMKRKMLFGGLFYDRKR